MTQEVRERPAHVFRVSNSTCCRLATSSASRSCRHTSRRNSSAASGSARASPSPYSASFICPRQRAISASRFGSYAPLPRRAPADTASTVDATARRGASTSRQTGHRGELGERVVGGERNRPSVASSWHSPSGARRRARTRGSPLSSSKNCRRAAARHARHAGTSRCSARQTPRRRTTSSRAASTSAARSGPSCARACRRCRSRRSSRTCSSRSCSSSRSGRRATR